MPSDETLRLQSLNDELNTILASVSCGILQYRKSDNALLRTNRAALEILGYETMEELIAGREDGVAGTVLPEDRRYINALVHSLNNPGDVRSYEYRVKHRGCDQIRYCFGTVQIYDDIHGERIILRTIMDITERKLSEEKLGRLFTMQRQMISSLGCGVFAYTLPEREVLLSNREAERMFAYHANSPLSLIETMLMNLLPEDTAEISRETKKLKATGDSCRYHLHPLSEDGVRITVECFTKRRAFADGQEFILSVLTDITVLEARTNELNSMNHKQEKMLAAIRKERQQYRDALLSGSEYSYRFDVTDGIIRSGFDYSVIGTLEDNLAVSLPIPFDNLIARWREMQNLVFLTPDDQNPMTSAQLLAYFERGKKNIVTEYFNAASQKYYRRTFLLSRDEETGHVWAIAIVSDITSAMREETRKRNELTMLNRDLRNQIDISKAFSSIYFASWEVDLDGKRMTDISVPDWIAPMKQASAENFSKLTELMISTFVKEDSRDAMRAFVCVDDMPQRLQHESILTCDYQSIRNGWSSACLIPYLRDEHDVVRRVIFAVRDISREKQRELEAKRALEEAYEAANRANAAKTEFLSSVSHDIRTPMNGIIGMTAIAGTHLDDRERVADCLAKISISSKHLLGLINEVLDMNKIESGKLDLNAEEFSLSDLIDTLLTMSKPQIEGKKHQLSVSIHNVEHEQVIGDALRIQQVFVNLLSNSIKYTPDGGNIRISLSEKATNRPKIGCFEFIIEDNGIGMSKEYQEKLFEPFTRAKDQRVEKIQGSGLGMPIARNIVRMMNGDIKVESELSKGTKFTVTMYLELQEPDDGIAIEEFTDLPILVADDDRIACESTCLILEELGMKGEWVLTGAEAVEKALARHEEENDYFAVILDWKMPGMDGVATARAIRKQLGGDIPIVILSAYDWSDIEQEARAAGVNAFISKPLFKSRISYLFKRLLGQEPEHGGGSAMEELSAKRFDGKRALLVEDNDLNAEIAKELLGLTGLEIEHATDGSQAVDAVTGHPKDYYDIIFMDIQMPVMNGYEAARAIRSLPGAYEKSVPIIAMTANAFAEDVQEAKSAGMNEHIAKPLNTAQLIKSLERWLS